MTSSRPSVSMVVPVLDEEELLESFLLRSIEEIGSLVETFEIIGVDDGSTDRTRHILRRMAAEYPQIRPLTLPRTSGIGLATVTGLRAARYDVVFWNTVDRVIDTRSCLAQALDGLAEGYDAITFYRQDLSGNTGWQKLMTFGNIALIHTLFPWHFKAYQQFHFQPTAFVDAIDFESSSHFISPELLFKTHVAGRRILQLPTVYHARTGGKPKGGQLIWVFKTKWDILRLWFKWCVLRHPMRFRTTDV